MKTRTVKHVLYDAQRAVTIKAEECDCGSTCCSRPIVKVWISGPDDEVSLHGALASAVWESLDDRAYAQEIRGGRARGLSWKEPPE